MRDADGDAGGGEQKSKRHSFRWYQYSIFTCMYLGYLMYCYDRRSFSYAMPALMEAEGLSKSDLGLVLSSQTTAYSLSKFVAGLVSDRVPPNIFFSAGLALAALSNVAFLWWDSVGVFSVLWFINGVAQGAGWPSCARVLRQWYPGTQLGRWWGVLTTSCNVAGVIGPFITTILITQTGSWRATLLVPGIMSLIISALAVIMIHNQPADVGYDNFRPDSSKKQDTSKSGSDRAGGDASGKMNEAAGKMNEAAGKMNEECLASGWSLVRSPFTFVLTGGYLTVFGIKTAVTDWGQLYLIQEVGGDVLLGSSFTSSVESGGLFGCLLSGYITDWMVARHQLRRERGELSSRGSSNPRLPAVYLFMCGISLGLYALIHWVDQDTSQVYVSALGVCLGACLYGPIAAFGVMATQCAPSHLAGTAHAIVALGANVGAVLAGLPLTYVSQHYNWSGVFTLTLIVNSCALAAMWLFRGLPDNMVPPRGDPKAKSE